MDPLKLLEKIITGPRDRARTVTGGLEAIKAKINEVTAPITKSVWEASTGTPVGGEEYKRFKENQDMAMNFSPMGVTKATKVLPKFKVTAFKNAMEALNDPAYLAKLKAAKTNKIPNGAKIIKIRTKNILPLEQQNFDDLTPSDVSFTKGPIHVVQTADGPLVLDGNHRLKDALRLGKETLDAIVFTPKEALIRYGEEHPQLKFVLDNLVK